MSEDAADAYAVFYVTGMCQRGFPFTDTFLQSFAKAIEGGGVPSAIHALIELEKMALPPCVKSVKIVMRDVVVSRILGGDPMTKASFDELIHRYLGDQLTPLLASQLHLSYHHLVVGKYAQGKRRNRKKRSDKPMES